MTFEAFDVVVVRFPFADRGATKRRPALVLSNRGCNEFHPVAVLTMITSAAHAVWPSDVPITDLAGAGLNAPSVVRMKLFTLDLALIDGRIGGLGRHDRKAVASMIGAQIL